jgi:hypothetical protein
MARLPTALAFDAEGLLVALGAVLAPPHLDIGVTERLPVDRPRPAVIVRRRFRAAPEAVRQHVEVQLRIAIEQLGAGRVVGAAMRRDEVLLLEQPGQAIARLLASPAPGSAFIAALAS